MLTKIEQWIDKTNAAYKSQRSSCLCFANDFDGFYPASFLENAYFVVIDTIPKPDLPFLREAGLGSFIDMSVDGITYKNTYYILPHTAENLRLHFHELVHVAQWRALGACNFIQRYLHEIQSHGYANAPLEKMAYGLDTHFNKNAGKISIPAYINYKLFKNKC